MLLYGISLFPVLCILFNVPCLFGLCVTTRHTVFEPNYNMIHGVPHVRFERAQTPAAVSTDRKRNFGRV